MAHIILPSIRSLFVIVLMQSSLLCAAQNISIKNDAQQGRVVFGNTKMQVTLDYKGKAVVSSMLLNNAEILDAKQGLYSMIKTFKDSSSSLQLAKNPVLTLNKKTVTLSGIVYGNIAAQVSETWTFVISNDNIKLSISRANAKSIAADQAGLPVMNFASINTWEGAYQDYGGLAWFYLFNKPLDTYGVHSSSSKFWNSKTGNGLSVEVSAAGKQVAMSYTRTADDKLSYSIATTQKELLPRFDSGTQRRRYIRDRTDVWEPITIAPGTSTQSITFSYFDFNQAYGRGTFKGINGDEAGAVLNTIARIGVIDKQHFGGNSWHTPYGPICLHEQYIAQMGLAINDKSYLKGYQDCLDFYRDNAIKPDGRVWPRWAYSNEDMMPGQVTDKGFYEAQWGFLLDANPDFVTNVAELYDQNGNKAWVKTHQRSCEKALDWLLKRDTNKNGLVEMITDSHTQKRGSDWIDIVWASFENAFVNAKLYHALVLWADIERQLGNASKYNSYIQAAQKLKMSFNKPVTEGGFWDNEKQCYVHWLDKDGSVHGRNMVTPVNFMAIGYGICDDRDRIKTILDNIETQMQKEQLFFWPLCMSSYEKGEVNDWQIPFPEYENGDIFLSWGSLGVRAYASYKPELAVKYVKNVLAQYAKDGLAFQRYGRAKQDGRGDDILSGNSLSVVGLYQAIYGINPFHNRFYLDPHITEELAGTQLKYHFRNQELVIDLDMNKYAVSNGQYTITSDKDFGFHGTGNELTYFNGSDTSATVKVQTTANSRLSLDIKAYSPAKIVWTQSAGTAGNNLTYKMAHLQPGASYSISVGKQKQQSVKSNAAGEIVFTCKAGNNPEEIVVENK